MSKCINIERVATDLKTAPDPCHNVYFVPNDIA